MPSRFEGNLYNLIVMLTAPFGTRLECARVIHADRGDQIGERVLQLNQVRIDPVLSHISGYQQPPIFLGTICPQEVRGVVLGSSRAAHVIRVAKPKHLG
jgi:hypothetical protein